MVPNILHIACFHFLLHLYLLPWTQAELFTAIAQMEPLLATQKRILDDLDDYVLKEEKRLAALKSQLALYDEEHEKAMEVIPNNFTMIKRLTSYLDDIEESIRKGTEYTKYITIRHADVKYPTSEDMAGAARALKRLQNTYRLNVHELSEGILNGVNDSFSMTAADCFQLSRALFNLRDFNKALQWSMESLRKFKKEKFTYSFTEVDILEYISSAHYLMRDVKPALEWTKKLLALDPKHPRARGNIPYYERTIKEQEQLEKQILRGDTGDEITEESKHNRNHRKEIQVYQALCRGEMEIPVDIAKRLSCRYLTENHPFLRLAPIKAEQKYIKPDVFVFHEVLSDEEIAVIQDLAMPRFQRAEVHAKVGRIFAVSYRIGKVAWLEDAASPVVARVSRRVADMTGLALDSAEDMQVVNYGIGGHYAPHYDFSRKTQSIFKDHDGNRIATVLFYMSEVAQGGATVFTELGLSVLPVKHAALFWLNLHPSGEGDMATRHAACPVLRGSKWVCNKWLHLVGQEFLKPCNLEYQGEEKIRKIPRAIPKTSR